MTRFHAKLIDAMVFDIFNSVHNQCGGDMKDTQKTLSFLFFGEDHIDECDHVSHPDVLKELMVKRMTHPRRFLKIFEEVHTFNRRTK